MIDYLVSNAILQVSVHAFGLKLISSCNLHDLLIPFDAFFRSKRTCVDGMSNLNVSLLDCFNGFRDGCFLIAGELLGVKCKQLIHNK